MQSRWSAIFVGTVVAVAVEMLLLSLGAGLGLTLVPVQGATEGALWGMGIGAAIYLGISVFVAYFVGGFLATRLFSVVRRDEIYAQGLAVWGTVLSVMLITASVVATPMSQIFGVAGAGAGAVSLWDEIKKAEPRIVSDVQLGKGLIVTKLETSPVRGATGVTTEEGAKDAAETALDAAGGASLGFFFGLLLAGVGSVAGAWAGRSSSQSKLVRRLSTQADVAA